MPTTKVRLSSGKHAVGRCRRHPGRCGPIRRGMGDAVGTTAELGTADRVREDETAADSAALAPLSLRAVTKCWPGAEPVLNRVDLDLEPGSVAAITGSNGAGKT